MKGPKRVILYREGTRAKAKERPNPDANSRWVCYHCGAGVQRKQDGTAVSHRLGGGRVITRRDDIQCLGSGARVKSRPGIKVRRPL